MLFFETWIEKDDDFWNRYVSRVLSELEKIGRIRSHTYIPLQSAVVPSGPLLPAM